MGHVDKVYIVSSYFAELILLLFLQWEWKVTKRQECRGCPMPYLPLHAFSCELYEYQWYSLVEIPPNSVVVLFSSVQNNLISPLIIFTFITKKWL